MLNKLWKIKTKIEKLQMKNKNLFFIKLKNARKGRNAGRTVVGGCGWLFTLASTLRLFNSHENFSFIHPKVIFKTTLLDIVCSVV